MCSLLTFRISFPRTVNIRINRYASPSTTVLRYFSLDRAVNKMPPTQLYLVSDEEGDRGGTVVKALCYKSKGRWFDPRWSHWNFSLTWSFRSHYGPGVDSASNRNEYQEDFLGVNAAGAQGWQPYHLPVPLSRNLGTSNSWNPMGARFNFCVQKNTTHTKVVNSLYS